MGSTPTLQGAPNKSQVRAGQPIVLFDGVCNFCNGTVQFILARDYEEKFRFAPLQSSAARELLEDCSLPGGRVDTIVLADGEKCFVKSTAALRIARELSGLWPILYVFVIVPRPLRDWFYDAFAKRRYSWFGKRESCFVPSEELKARFLE